MVELICTVPLRSGGEMAYYAIPAKGGDSCVRFEGLGACRVSFPALSGALAWAGRRAGRQVDIQPDGRIRFYPGENG